MNSMLLTIEGIRILLRIGKTKAYELVKSGELRSLKVGNGRRIHKDDLDKFLNHLRERDDD